MQLASLTDAKPQTPKLEVSDPEIVCVVRANVMTTNAARKRKKTNIIDRGLRPRTPLFLPSYSFEKFDLGDPGGTQHLHDLRGCVGSVNLKK